jgi:hypothetical protein
MQDGDRQGQIRPRREHDHLEVRRPIPSFLNHLSMFSCEGATDERERQDPPPPGPNGGDAHGSRRPLPDDAQTALGPPADRRRLPGAHVHRERAARPVPQSVRAKRVSERQVGAVLDPGPGHVPDSGGYTCV